MRRRPQEVPPLSLSPEARNEPVADLLGVARIAGEVGAEEAVLEGGAGDEDDEGARQGQEREPRAEVPGMPHQAVRAGGHDASEVPASSVPLRCRLLEFDHSGPL